MARKNKVGLQYFNIETDRYQDLKIKKLIHAFSVSGISIYDFLLNEIYRDKGCFIVWGECTAFNVADVLKIKESLVNEVVNYCCSVGLFNKAVLTSESVLTSKAIQERYIMICKLCRRGDVIIDKAINLITTEESVFMSEEMVIITEEMPFMSEESTQSKVNKSKVKNYIIIGSEKVFDLPQWFDQTFPIQKENFQSKYPLAEFTTSLNEFLLVKAMEIFKNPSHFRNSFNLFLKGIHEKNERIKRSNVQPPKGVSMTLDEKDSLFGEKKTA